MKFKYLQASVLLVLTWSFKLTWIIGLSVFNRRLGEYVKRKRCPRSVIKTGIYWNLLLAMDDRTFQQHMSITQA